MTLRPADLRFLWWLRIFCSPAGTTIGKVSPVAGRLGRHGFIVRKGHDVALTETGRQALRADRRARREAA